MFATMKDSKARSRYIVRPRLGTKICLLVALLFCVAAAYFYWMPLAAATSNGPKFDCQSAFRPPRDEFGKNSCSNINEIYQFRAVAALAGGLLIGLVGALLFGFTKIEAKPSATTPAMNPDDKSTVPRP